MGFIITELDMGGCKISRGEEKDALKRRGFRDGVDLHLGAIKQLIERKREREREREREKEHAEKYQTHLISIRRQKLVRMNEKCMNI